MIFPASSLREEAISYLQVGVSSSEQGKGSGNVGLRFVGTQAATSGNGFDAGFPLGILLDEGEGEGQTTKDGEVFLPVS